MTNLGLAELAVLGVCGGLAVVAVLVGVVLVLVRRNRR